MPKGLWVEASFCLDFLLPFWSSKKEEEKSTIAYILAVFRKRVATKNHTFQPRFPLIHHQP
jgi:hypothetical protein